jgi:prepilin-type N-terminal cleavage/methylation domain-containing protein
MKKGFTLIELLAVIVIIGVVAMITSPIMVGVLEHSSKGAFEDSVYGLIKSVDLDKAESGFNINRVYTITNGNISPALETKNKINGDGIIKLDEDGNIELSIEYDKWCATKEYSSKTVEIDPAPCITNADPTNANSPWLLSNMIPVRWNGTNWVKADKRNPEGTEWYDYSVRQWANAVVVRESGVETRDYYESDTAIGDVIYDVDILGHFVWIPRFNYTIPTGTGARTITINFEQGVPTKSNGDGIGSASSDYLTHPAFTFGDKELIGFWFAKFETTGNLTNMTIKPGVGALVNNAFVNIYNGVRELSLANNAYGFIPSRVDIRIAKNNEWGAVSYLTNSIYGKNATLWKNPSTTYLTGCAGTTATAAGSIGCAHHYNSANGVQASTTGNIYGVYDMAGGAYDLVMGNYLEVPGSSGLNQFPDDKYFNKYTTTTAATACNFNPCYGQALSDTSGWYSGATSFITYDNPWLLRGNVSSINIASQYSFNSYNGGTAANTGFRLSISNK